MAATPLSPGNEHELAALRARAYGPDADIALDSRELARLTELERIARPDAASATAERTKTADGPTAGLVAAPDPVRPWWRRVPVSTLVVGCAVLGVGIGLTAPGSTVISASARPRRSAPAWTLMAGAAVVGIVVGMIAPLVMAPKVVAQLRPTAESGVEFPFDLIAVDPAALVRYDDFDAATVWAIDSDEGNECLFVSVRLEWMDSGCTPGDLDATVDINVTDDTDFADFLDLPSGSLVRFVLREDVVEVFVAEAAEPQTLRP